jgi:hypothetical protein
VPVQQQRSVTQHKVEGQKYMWLLGGSKMFRGGAGQHEAVGPRTDPAGSSVDCMTNRVAIISAGQQASLHTCMVPISQYSMTK